MEKRKSRKQADPSSKHSPDPVERNFARVTGLVMEVVVFNLICIWGGYKLNEMFSPRSYWILILGILFSVGGTIYYLIKKTVDQD